MDRRDTPGGTLREGFGLLRSIGLWRAVLIRLRADWPVVAAAWALLLCATTLLTAGTLYGDAVALGGIRAAITDAAPRDRAIVVKTAALTSEALGLDAPIRTELRRVTAQPGGEIAEIVRTDPFVVTGATAATGTATGAAGTDTTGGTAAPPQLIAVASYEGIERHANLVTGRWAASSGSGSTSEATLSEGAAAALGVGVGGTIALTGRLDPSVSVSIQVVGIWRPAVADTYWLATPLELDGTESGGGFTTVGPLVVPVAAMGDATFGARRTLEWRVVVDASNFRLDDVDAVLAAADQLPDRLSAVVPAGIQVRVETRLPAILAAVSRSALVSRTGVILLVIQFAILAAYAIVLVAGMLADRRRAETALLRSRGASSAHLAGMAILEAAILTGLAALVAPLLALGAVRWLSGSGPLATSGIAGSLGIGRDALVVDGVTAIACIVALTLPMLSGVPSLAGVRAAISRQTGRTLAQRLGLDLVLVVLAGVALWQLRLYGAPLTRNARGVLGVDPLLVAAPGIGLLAGAVVATRIIPRIAELAERFLQRGRGLVAAMGGRGLARRPLRYTRSALLLMLAAALGTFASAHAATWTRSQGDQAAYQSGADLRVLTSGRGLTAAMGTTIRAIPGVSLAMPADRSTVDSGRGVRGGPLLAIDAAIGASIVLPTPDADGAGVPSLLGLLAEARPAPPGAELPAGSRSVAVLVDTAFENASFDPAVTPPDPATVAGVRITFVLSDGDGLIYRMAAKDDGLLAGTGQRLAVPLPASAGGSPAFTFPLRLLGIEIDVAGSSEIVYTGTLEVTGFEVTGFEVTDIGPGAGQPGAGDPGWTPLAVHPGDDGWEWIATPPGGGPGPYHPAAGPPWRLTYGADEGNLDSGNLDPIFGSQGPSVRLSATGPATAPIAAIAGRAFLAATGAVIGDTVQASLAGGAHRVRIMGAVDTFPTLDPSKPFLVVDGPTLAAARFAATGGAVDPDEWWVRATDPVAVGEAVLAGPDPAATIVSRPALETTLATDPVPLGVVGVLGLGSIAALLFAAIGFVVAATVSTRERLGEFALLRALGLSGRQLSLWLALENAFLLVVGLVTGIGLGLLLAEVVLPVATLTASGGPAIPAPVVVIPTAALLPIPVVAVAVFLVTLLVLRRQLLQVKVSDVLRGRDE